MYILGDYDGHTDSGNWIYRRTAVYFFVSDKIQSSVVFLSDIGQRGCLNLMVIMFRNGLLMWYDKYAWVRWKGWIAILSAVCIVILAFTWKGAISLLPFAALIASNVGYWTNNAQKIRLSNLACASPCWLIYDILVGSWGGVLNESITLGSILLSIYRYGWKAMGDPDSEFQKR